MIHKLLANFDKLGEYYLLKDSGSFTRVISSLVSTILPDRVGLSGVQNY
jgi:hypothetical protein